jgi:hypothetical protein
MEEAEAEMRVIAKVYRGPDGGKPAYKTYLDAKAIEPGITLNLVKGWFKLNVEPKNQVWGQRNSYVAPSAYHEYQVDLFFVTKKQFKNQKLRVGLSMIDVFSKYAVVIPLKEKNGEEVMAAIFKGFTLMGKQPDILYTDEDGALSNVWVPAVFEEAGIQHITAGTAYFVERFNRTFKNRMADRLKYLLKSRRVKGKQPEEDKTQYQWTDLIPFVMTEYNTKNKHRITGMTPVEARKPSSEADAKAGMEMAATFGKKFPILQVGDTVRTLKKNKLGDKDFMDKFKPGKHKVERISENFGQKFYMLSDRKEYIRSDIVKMIN